jgi:hypothetical protein
VEVILRWMKTVSGSEPLFGPSCDGTRLFHSKTIRKPNCTVFHSKAIQRGSSPASSLLSCWQQFTLANIVTRSLSKLGLTHACTFATIVPVWTLLRLPGLPGGPRRGGATQSRGSCNPGPPLLRHCMPSNRS